MKQAIARAVFVGAMVIAMVLGFGGSASAYWSVIDLGTLGGNYSSAYSINDNGQIVGVAEDSSGGYCACRFYPPGGGANINLGGLGGYRNDNAKSINNSDQIVGGAHTGPGFSGRACLFDPTGGGANKNLGILPGYQQSGAHSNNNKGQIVGCSLNYGPHYGSHSHACIFYATGGSPTDLGTLGGYNYSYAYSINNSGQIVGLAYDSSGHSHACLFDPTGGGANIDLGGLGGGWSCASSINDHAQIVGSAQNSSGDSRACLFDPTGQGNNIDLNSLIDPASGWTLTCVSDISNNGWIVGYGRNPAGYTHAYLLLVPEPSDTTPPTTTISLSGTLGNNGWYVSDVQVALSAADEEGGSGVAKTEYSFNGNDWITYTAPFPVSAEGTTTVYYRSTDNAGNVEPTKTEAIKIDKDPPTVVAGTIASCYATRAEAEAAALAATTATDNCTPPESLVRTVSTEGDCSAAITVTVTDECGNSAFVVYNTRIDDMPPVVSIQSPVDGKIYQNTEGSIPVVFTATDNCDLELTIAMTLDGGPFFGSAIDVTGLALGAHTLTVTATDDCGYSDTESATFIINGVPICGQAYPSVAEIWPPNHQMVPIEILGVTDPDGDPLTITITKITQDEPINGYGDGDTSPDGGGVGTSIAQVRAERAGSKKVPGNGRVYGIGFLADDGRGGVCSGSVSVCVPHDMSSGHACVDSGQNYDSTR